MDNIHILPIPKESWFDISVDFILSLPRLRKGKDYICGCG